MNPTVSAIIIFRDGLPYISEAIDSVMSQTYEPLELILIDDGSTDGSEKIAARLSAGAPSRIRFLQHPGAENRGMSASRNLGARHARGKYIAFLDADDVWLEHKTREQVEILAQHDEVGMVYGKTQIWYSWAGTETLKPDFFYDLGVATNQKYPAGRLLANLVENKFQTPTTCNAMIRRDAYWSVGGFEDSFTGMYEDQAFFAKLYCKWPTFVAENYWARYRQHAGNAQAKFCKINYLKERKELLGFISRYARTHPNTLDQPTRAVLRTERLRTLFPRVTDYLERRGTHRLGRKD